MKKTISLLLIFTFLFVCMPTAAASNIFTDVNENSWYYESVMSAYEQGIMVGVSENQFDPSGTVTREMFVTALARTFDIDTSQYKVQLPYRDARTESWYTEALKWGYLTEVVYGTGDKQFGIGAAVTREEIATFVMRVLQNNFLTVPDSENAAEPFTDTPSKWAVDAVEVMRKGGLLFGKSKGVFAPKDNATRAEVAAILVRIKQARAGFIADFDFKPEETIVSISSSSKFATLIDGSDIIDCVNNCSVTKTEFLGTMADVEIAREILDARFKERTAVYIGNEITLAVAKEGIIYNEYLYTVDQSELAPIYEALESAQ